jgi:acyl dehydratase
MTLPRYEEFDIGMQAPEQRFEVDPLTLVKYCGAADDYARQHWDHLYMTEMGFDGVVGHGWLTFAYMCRIVTDWVPLEVADIRSYAVRYHRPTLPGVLRCGAEVVGKNKASGKGRLELRLWAKDAAGQMIASSPMTLEFA